LFAITRRHLYPPVAVLVLSALVLALLPTVAEAQEKTAATPDARGAERVVVRPGDSLWSISEDLLGPNASPRQIAEKTERIYALNRGLIGGDPNLIFQGQKLLLPQVAGATPARNAAEQAEASPKGRGLKSERERASKTAVGETGSKAGQEATDPVAEPVALPDMPTKQVTPEVGSPSVTDAPSPVESFGRTARALLLTGTSAIAGLSPQDPLLGRKLLGGGIMLLTLMVGGFMAWKLRMKRHIGASAAWRIRSDYYSRYAYSEPLDRHGLALEVPVSAEAPDSREDALKAPVTASAPKQDTGGSDGGVNTAENGLAGAGVIGTVRGRRERTRRRKRAPRSRPPRGGAMSGTYGRAIRQTLSRATHKTRSPRSAKSRAGQLGRGSLAMEVMPSGHLGGAWLASEPSVPSANGDGLPDPRMLLLSARQWETLELAGEGLRNAQIARRLFITESTVKQHLRKAYSTLGIRNRREAASLFVRNDQAGRRLAEEEVGS
jgi:DNA-binding CsgD family transcriptional regulator